MRKEFGERIFRYQTQVAIKERTTRSTAQPTSILSRHDWEGATKVAYTHLHNGVSKVVLATYYS